MIHDERLERTANGHGKVSQHTLAELQLLDAGTWFSLGFVSERILTLSDVLAWSGALLLVLDLKAKPFASGRLLRALVAVLQAHGAEQRALVTGADILTQRRLHTLAPRLRTSSYL